MDHKTNVLVDLFVWLPLNRDKRGGGYVAFYNDKLVRPIGTIITWCGTNPVTNPPLCLPEDLPTRESHPNGAHAYAQFIALYPIYNKQGNIAFYFGSVRFCSNLQSSVYGLGTSKDYAVADFVRHELGVMTHAHPVTCAPRN